MLNVGYILGYIKINKCPEFPSCMPCSPLFEVCWAPNPARASLARFPPPSERRRRDTGLWRH